MNDVNMNASEANGLGAIRKKLAAQYPQFAEADRREQNIESFCLQLRARLKEARKNLGIDQAKLADKMQVGQPMVSRIETGTGDIGLKTLCRYADALGLSLSIDIVNVGTHSVKGLEGAPAPAAAVEKALGAVDEAREALLTASAQLAAA